MTLLQLRPSTVTAATQALTVIFLNVYAVLQHEKSPNQLGNFVKT